MCIVNITDGPAGALSTLLQSAWPEQDDTVAAHVQRDDAWDGPACGVRAHHPVEQVAQEMRAAVSVHVAVDRNGALQAASAALDGKVGLPQVADRG